jgi:hypothetical protein
MRAKAIQLGLFTIFLVSAGTAFAQSAGTNSDKVAPPAAAIHNSNPASSSSIDDSGTNPAANEGANSPTGQGPTVQTMPRDGSTTTGSGTAPARPPATTAPTCAQPK